ncbi:hypothetical protein CPAV1605_581 [seawater metagenome]|uniref:Uncharacterized protein n=1 Tax=seawater metagenome TaxID=1561972 RepID=A0A5E8CIF2_9ZZZZ
MKIIIYILLFLLVVSIANNYVLHKYQNNEYAIAVNPDIISPSELPKNIGIVSLYFFYNKDKKYNKCLANDKNQKVGENPLALVQLQDAIDEIYKKTNNNCYIVVKDNNKDNFDLKTYLPAALNQIS